MSRGGGGMSVHLRARVCNAAVLEKGLEGEGRRDGVLAAWLGCSRLGMAQRAQRGTAGGAALRAAAQGLQSACSSIALPIDLLPGRAPPSATPSCESLICGDPQSLAHLHYALKAPYVTGMI